MERGTAMNASTAFPAIRRRLLAALVALLVVGCGGAASGPNLDTVGSAVGGGPSAAPTAGPAGAGALGDGTGNVIPEAARADLQVIKTGALDLQVRDVGAAVVAGAAKIAALGGYVSGSEQSGEDEGVTATVTYRVPADQWDPALAALRALAIKVVDEKTQTQDVTGQIVDLGARIANLKATELALQAIMTKATKISDVLDVQAELTKVRGEIEQAAGEKQHLQEQASYSTLTVRFGLKPSAAVVLSQEKFDPRSEVDRASATLVEILQGLATAGIWFGIVWLPILLTLGIVALVVIAVVRRRSTAQPTVGIAGVAVAVAPPIAPPIVPPAAADDDPAGTTTPS